MLDLFWLWMAFFMSIVGMGAWAWGDTSQTIVRYGGATALLLAGTACLRVDQPSMALLVWLMLLTAAALLASAVKTWMKL